MRDKFVTAAIALLLAAAAVMVMAQPPQLNQEIQATKAFALWRRGYLLHMGGAYEDAVAAFSESIELLPTAQAHTFRGWSLSMLGRLNEAIAACKEAIRLDPDYGNPYNDIGVYLIDLNRPEEAIPWLNKAIRADRYCCYHYPHFNLGRVLWMQGEVESAIKSFENALAHQSDYAPALEALAYIRSQGLAPL